MPVPGSEAPGLEEAETWINSDRSSLENGTYLLDFWSHTCVGCRRIASLLQEVHREISGLEVIGVHTPEFGFENDRGDVRSAVEKQGIEYPVALDPEGRLREAYENRYRPRQTLVQDGKIVWKNTGKTDIEGLKDKLAEMNGSKDVDTLFEDISIPSYSEIHLGFDRGMVLNGGKPVKERKFSAPQNRRVSHPYLQGMWKQKEEYLEARENSEIYLKCGLSELNVVVSPSDGIKDLEVLLDGETVPESHAGTDLRIEDSRSYVRVGAPGLYNIIGAEDEYAEITLIPDRNMGLYMLGFR